jgi:alkanesulfonate monooxygenase SsuD/methylene tetrahydromethanopterin reductase-like flavin-dependent oxidoreductase (luciferase family)
MDIGIGLPSTVPGVDRESLLEWARRADRRGFSTVGTIDRIVYANYEPLIALAAAAAVTERIRLTTAILISPLHQNAALLAKQLATLHHLSGGRLVVGAAPGGREDDYEVSGIDIHTRGRAFDRQLDEMKRVWAGEEKGYAGPVGPNLVEPPQLLIGGSVDASFRRAAAYGDGWIMGGGDPSRFVQSVERLEEAWQSAGRQETPRKASLTYFSLGPDADKNAAWYLGDYYGWLGEQVTSGMAQGAARDADSVAQRVAMFEEAGCDELILFPCSSDPAQVDLLADAVPVSARP